MKYYVIDENKNMVEALDKEAVEALLARAIQEGQLPSVDEDTAFVTMLKDPHTGETHKVAFVTQSQYNQLKADDQLIVGAYYFITDDTTADDLETALANLTEIANTANDGVNSINNLLDTASTKVEEYPDIDDFIKWAYPISRNFPEGSVFTMSDINTEYICFKGLALHGSFIVAKFVLPESGADSSVVFHLISGIYIDEQTGEADFTDNVMAYQSEVSKKSDKPTGIATSASIAKAGLYAVSVQSGTSSDRITFMVSVDNINYNCDSSTFGNGTFTYHVSYNSSAHKFTAYYNNGSSIEEVRILKITLVAEY